MAYLSYTERMSLCHELHTQEGTVSVEALAEKTGLTVQRCQQIARDYREAGAKRGRNITISDTQGKRQTPAEKESFLNSLFD